MALHFPRGTKWWEVDMMSLPMELVDGFEAKLERTWCGSGVSAAKRRDALVLGLGLCGLRWIECVRVRRADLRAVSCRLEVRSAKGGVPRVVLVGRSWTEAARRNWGGGDPSSALFSTAWGGELRYEQVRRRCREWTRAFFGEPYSFHCLRHTAAVRLYQASHDVVAVQRLLGHRSLQWTTVYLAGVEDVGALGMPSFVEGSRGLIRLFDPDGLAGRRRRA